MVARVKAVRIMCEYCADGVWSTSSVPNSSMEGFRVSDALWARIQRWQRWYETHDPRVDIDPDFDWDGFTIEGLLIARAVKAELPDWIVIYYDEQISNYYFFGERSFGIGDWRCFSEIEISDRLH